MHFDPIKNQLHDVFGGQADLENQTLRCVGDPLERFNEDRLRILRVLRFASQLNFFIEEQTLSAVKSCAPRLVIGFHRGVSAQRLIGELSKMLMAENINLALFWLNFSGVGPQIFRCFALGKNFKEFCQEIIGEDISLQKVDDQGIDQQNQKLGGLVLAGLPSFVNYVFYFETVLHGGCNEATRNKLIDIGFSKKTVDQSLKTLLAFRKYQNSGDFFDFALAFDSNYFLDFLDMVGFSCYHKRVDPEQVEKDQQRYLEICQPDGSLEKPYVNGTQLQDWGFAPGQQIKNIIDAAYRKQIAGELKTLDEAQDWVSKTFKIP